MDSSLKFRTAFFCAFGLLGLVFSYLVFSVAAVIYVQRRIQGLETSGLAGASEEAARLRTIRGSRVLDHWREVGYMLSDIAKQLLFLSYRILW